MIVFKNKKFYLENKKIKLPNGEIVEFASLVKQPGTNIIPLIDKDTILMIKQYRPAIKKWIYQLAGGKVEKEETPLQNAFKEIEEELGYKADKMKVIAKFYTAPHISNDFQYLFLATKLKKTKSNLEKGEIIKPKRIKIKDTIKMIHDGKIIDSITIASLLMLKDLKSVENLIKV
jgi:ADP-ribose pyrophosphatase